MPPLFEEVKINRMVLKNRSVRSATWTGLAEADGRCGPRLIDFYERLAHGEIGLIVTGLAYTLPNGKAVPRQLGICDDEMIAGLLKLTERIHRADGKIAMQIAHCGAQTLHRDQPISFPGQEPAHRFIRGSGSESRKTAL